MLEIGVPSTVNGKKALLLGSGEIGKEIAIELQRYGIYVIAADRYAGAPAMSVANKAFVIPMDDGDSLRNLVEVEKPDFIVPEIEAINTEVLCELENEGWNVVPNAQAVRITMNRAEIRNFVAGKLCLPTSEYEISSNYEEFLSAVGKIGLPCVVKPVMSSSGHGQSIVKEPAEVDEAWLKAMKEGRIKNTPVIVESFVDFDYEITLLTVRHISGTSFCEPIGHFQENGDYRLSWQPQTMAPHILDKAKEMAGQITDALGGYGIFGVEFFVKGDELIFSEIAPRPHDTGFVTLISQNFSEFALHVRAFLGLPVPKIEFYGPSASKAIIAEGNSKDIVFSGLEKALMISRTDIRIFGKPEVNGYRRVGVMTASAETIEAAVDKVEKAASLISIKTL